MIMKKKLYIVAAILLAGICRNAKAQESGQVDPLKENISLDIDKLGDARITMSVTYNASQWQTFTNVYGSNAADLMKRQTERGLPSWYLQNWNYKDDPVNHTWTLSFDALGLAKIDDNGNWVLQLDQKKPDITKLSDHNYIMTANYNASGMLVQELWKINLPAAAGSVNQDKDAFGNAIFTYEMTPGHGGLNLIYIVVGLLLIVAAAVTYFKPDLFKSPGKPSIKPFTVVTAQQPAATVAAPEPPAATPDIEKQA